MAEKKHPVKIGLEIHGYLDTVEKLFCMCRARESEREAGSGKREAVNSNVCPICTGTPGSKPMAVNEAAIKKMIQIAHVFGSRINTKDLVWQRKHYDWADNPKGFQTTMSGEHAIVNAEGGRFKGINITELHLEEDPAQWNPDTGKINYNRSGLPLVEIVTEPEFKESEEVVEWLKSLLVSLSYIKAVRKNAGIKVDVNVSTYGERVEMKNLNSLEKIRKAIEYEIRRQLDVYEGQRSAVGGQRLKELLPQETRAYDDKKGITIRMRTKEGKSDYRFIPDPDLPVMKIDSKLIEEIGKSMPEMPEVKLERLLKTHRLEKKDAEILAKNLELVDFFEELAKSDIDVKKNVDWITVELLRVLNYNKKTLEDEDVEILPEHLAELIGAVEAGTITRLKGKQIMNDFVPKSFSLAEHGEEVGSISKEAVENLCRQVMNENAHVVREYRAGKAASLNFLIGQVMRLSDRRADFRQVGDVLREMIGG